MSFLTTSALMDSVVLASLSRQDGYGYVITQNVIKILDVSESTLYPTLRRLQKEGYLEVYDRQENGRNRRYYKMTEGGSAALKGYIAEWKKIKTNLDLLYGGKHE